MLQKISLLLLMFSIFTACNSIKRLMPEGPVLTKKQRNALEKTAATSGVRYTGEAKVSFPLQALQIWAATYDLDIVIVSDNPKWNMHELARLQTPQGPLWIMKDALNETMEQSIIANIPEVQAWLPEIPVKRKFYPVEVRDSSTAKKLDLDFRYENLAGELCEIHYEGPWPKQAQPKRNGSTMGHSRTQLIAVLDLPYRNFGKKTSISFDGKAAKVKKILGIVPFRMALIQTQAGISIGRFEQFLEGTELKSRHLDKEKPSEQAWSSTEKDGKTLLLQDNELRSIGYQYLGRDTLELEKAWVDMKFPQHRAFEISFFPPLPDLRRPFEGTAISTFVMDANGQKSNAIGRITASWTSEGPQLLITPEKPWWVKDRPMIVKILYTEKEKATIKIERR